MPLDIYIGLVFTAVAIMLLIRHRHSNAVKGIAVGIGLLLLTVLAVNFHLGYLLNYLNGRQLLYNNGFVSYFYFISPVIFILFSYYYTGKYCGKRWKKPSWEWGFWLTLPIIGFTVIWYMKAKASKYSDVSGVGGLILIALIITYFVLLLVSSYGGYVGAKSVQQEEEISE